MFITNSFEFLQECLSTENKSEIEAHNFSDLTVININNRQEIFDDLMKKLATDEADFFTGNIASLLDAMNDVKQVEIRRNADNNFLSEEMLFKFESIKVQ